MIQDLQLRGYADRTIEAYVHAVAQLAKSIMHPPTRSRKSRSATICCI
jgi:hypothetical protein